MTDPQAAAGYTLAMGYSKQRAFEPSMSQLDLAFHRDPDFLDAHRLRGRADHGLGNPDTAIDDYTRAASLTPDVQIYVRRATV